MVVNRGFIDNNSNQRIKLVPNCSLNNCHLINENPPKWFCFINFLIDFLKSARLSEGDKAGRKPLIALYYSHRLYFLKG